jgi:predicted RNase H-like HicB family nuclease
MKRPFAVTAWREGKWYVSQCLEVDVASQGETEEEALANLKEAIELHFEPPLATRPPQVSVIEAEVGAA